MPIKWTAETDQTLLLKILETSNINADVKAIAAAWPKNLEAPTPRAISERLVKIRATAKSSGIATHFSVSKGQNSKPPTPRKATAGRPAGVKKPGTGAKKTARAGRGKRGGKFQDSLTEEFDNEEPSFEESSLAAFNANLADADDTIMDESAQVTIKTEQAPEDDISSAGIYMGEPSDADDDADDDDDDDMDNMLV